MTTNDAAPTWVSLSCCHYESVRQDTPDPDGAQRLADHFSATIELRIAEIQPQYGLVQLNAMRRACGCLVSCDVKRDDFLAAVARVLNVTINDNPCDCAERLRAEAKATEPTRETPLSDIPAHAHKASWYRAAARFLEGKR